MSAPMDAVNTRPTTSGAASVNGEKNTMSTFVSLHCQPNSPLSWLLCKR